MEKETLSKSPTVWRISTPAVNQYLALCDNYTRIENEIREMSSALSGQQEVAALSFREVET